MGSLFILKGSSSRLRGSNFRSSCLRGSRFKCSWVRCSCLRGSSRLRCSWVRCSCLRGSYFRCSGHRECC